MSLTGLSKQDFITSKLLDRTINVQANCKVHRAVFDRLGEVLDELKRLEDLKNARKELERTQGEKPVSQKIFKAI